MKRVCEWHYDTLYRMINLVSFNKNNKKKKKKKKKGTVNKDIKNNQISTYERLIGWLVG